MWIRSQGRCVLKDCDEFSVGEYGGKVCIYGVKGEADPDKNLVALGKYDSRERCIEVLDEIQMVTSQQYAQISSSDNNGSVYTAMNVYQMPEK